MKEKNIIAPINEEENGLTYEPEKIKNMIYTIRGKQVILDSDVAILYQCETKYINRVVKRNIERFPEDFCFQLLEKEYENLRCQFVTLNSNGGRGQHRKYLPYVFTEQGIAMLSALLKSEIAVKVSISIMKAFIEMRKFLSTNNQIFERLYNVENKLLEHDKKFNYLFNELQKNAEEELKQRVFLNGEIWDSYSLIIDIIKKADKKILIIDNYIDDSIFKMLQRKNKGVEVIILTSQNCYISKLDVKKFNEQYPTLKIARSNKFHDRFIIIDNKELYHCGASLKDLGKKCFAISKIEDIEYIDKIINLK